jgi:sugar O-acyltransferase (sialic acid O-acetyltransferase NeuD family)
VYKIGVISKYMRYNGIMMKRLIIVGAGGFGREVLCYANDIETNGCDWKVYGFLNDDEYADALDNYNVPYSIIGSIKGYIPQDDDVFVCAIGDPKAKLQICKSMKARGAKFISLIHPTAYIGQRVKWGEGLIVAPRANIGPDVKLGDFVTINTNSVLGHDTDVGEGTTFYGYDVIAGKCIIEEGVSVYLNAALAPGIKIGKNVKIGIGSVVVKSVKADVTVFGNPAKIIY